ncbi:PREDICTED: UBX domain-containing protein 8-like isoform X2 [Elephantulus edwardii]|uniref:UBX domain-containing protein 8-like isoform X2 n=1 Tax=Elephantulus edwardii TaxID=28737 RepID=UPI0003F0D61D|nr:PREDICTED: UBX domain-containing protein 8-like isoform X2 [Elephantulus edwardii]
MASRGVVIFLLAAIPILCLELRRGIPHLGIRDLILLCGQIFLLLAVLTLIISVTTSWLKSFKRSQVCLKGEEEEENEKRRKLVRKQQQEIQSEKTNLVLENASLASFETSNREAAKRRKLPNSGTRVTAPVECPPQKKVLDLPEEPPETADEVVTVALRCPSGRFLRRRFFKSCQSQVLLDWMMKIGYHTSLYALSTSFPRRPLDMKGSWTLEDIGITVDTVLNVEEKEQSN